MDVKKFDCYSILEIARNASYDEIKSAFRSMSKLLHPDVVPGGSAEEQIRLNLAYEILTDPVLKEQHDRFWNKPRTRKNPSGWQTGRSRAARARKSAGSSAGAGNRQTKRQHPEGNADTSARTDADAYAKSHEPRSSPTSFEVVRARALKELHARKKEIESSLSDRKKAFYAEYSKLFKKKRFLFSFKTLFVSAAISGGFLFPLFFLPGLLLAAVLLVPDLRVHLDYDSIFVYSVTWKKRIERAARLEAEFAIKKELAGLSRYEKTLGLLKEEVVRGSRIGDPEPAVAGRIAFALFFMGYVPSGYDPKTRTARFSISSDTLFVRYRHRTGARTNVAYVKKMIDLMHEEKASSGIIFSSPGLSGKALLFAKEHGIASYTLAEMNAWMRSVYASGHEGPTGSVLDALDSLADFIRSIARGK